MPNDHSIWTTINSILNVLFGLFSRCKSFQSTKRGELCRIPGSSVSPVTAGSPVVIRLPHVNADVFRQFILYVYTGKVSVSYILGWDHTAQPYDVLNELSRTLVVLVLKGSHLLQKHANVNRQVEILHQLYRVCLPV